MFTFNTHQSVSTDPVAGLCGAPCRWPNETRAIPQTLGSRCLAHARVMGKLPVGSVHLPNLELADLLRSRILHVASVDYQETQGN